MPSDSSVADLHWHDPTASPFRLAGFAWYERDRKYRRLPLEPDWPIPEVVDRLAGCTAGGQVQFQTDSPRLAMRVTLKAPADMDHMPATGQCGMDCYLGPPKRQRYVGTTRFDHTKASYEAVLFDLPLGETRHVTLNLPLYQGVREVLVGLTEGASVSAPLDYDDDRPIVVYGTSITQGGCASRPGMCYTNTLSRRLNRPFVNLGFSGSGKGEPELARLVAQIADPACLVLDYEANAWQDDLLARTLSPFLAILRESHATTPILVVSRTKFATDSFDESISRGRRQRIEARDFQRRTVEALRDAGDPNVFFLDGGDLLGPDFDECTVDGAHPTDLGFLRIANGLTPLLERILAGQGI